MTAISIAVPHIRKLNVRDDLLAVADLIEICFASTLDADGREYLRHLRMSARDAHYLSWLQGAAERLASPFYGFVWEEDHRIVGNLSLIPMYRQGKLIYLIANVAVHPHYRGRGIARQLTQRAITYLQERNVRTAWLQVRDDNPVAIHLYDSLGFKEQARRTTWHTANIPPIPRQPFNGITIHRRRSQAWPQHLSLLQQAYPAEVIWNLPLNYSRLAPGVWSRILSFLHGELREHWEARVGERAVGFISWEPTRSLSDTLWLAVAKEYEEQAVESLLIHARQALMKRGRGLSVNYPAGQASEAFLKAGFVNHQTLIWMAIHINPSPSL